VLLETDNTDGADSSFRSRIMNLLAATNADGWQQLALLEVEVAQRGSTNQPEHDDICESNGDAWPAEAVLIVKRLIQEILDCASRALRVLKLLFVVAQLRHREAHHDPRCGHNPAAVGNTGTAAGSIARYGS